MTHKQTIKNSILNLLKRLIVLASLSKAGSPNELRLLPHCKFATDQKSDSLVVTEGKLSPCQCLNDHGDPFPL
jgi:hypothetical protein